MMPSSKSSPTPKPSFEWSFEAIGTHWWIGIYNDVASTQQHELKRTIAGRIETFDAAYSRFRDDSLVSAIARAAGTYSLPQDAVPLLTYYKHLYDLTGGKVTPLIGQLLSDTGYDATYTLKPKTELTVVPEWPSVMHVQDGKITTKQPVLLDFGAAGKGYLVDIVCELLEQSGVQAYCVDAGGDMRVSGLAQPLQIGLENPDNNQQVIGVVTVQNGALCGSSGNRRAWAGYNHILDPKLQSSPQHLKAVWVYAREAMLADGLTTALYFADANTLAEQYQFEYLLMYSDNTVTQSTHFPATLFTKE